MDPHYFGCIPRRIRIPIHKKEKKQKLKMLKMEPWKAVNAHNGGVEALVVVLKVSVDQQSQIRITLRIRIRIKVKSWMVIRINVKRGIRSRIKAMQIRNPVNMCPMKKGTGTYGTGRYIVKSLPTQQQGPCEYVSYENRYGTGRYNHYLPR
jgi:hypothetical protein